MLKWVPRHNNTLQFTEGEIIEMLKNVLKNYFDSCGENNDKKKNPNQMFWINKRTFINRMEQK